MLEKKCVSKIKEKCVPVGDKYVGRNKVIHHGTYTVDLWYLLWLAQWTCGCTPHDPPPQEHLHHDLELYITAVWGL